MDDNNDAFDKIVNPLDGLRLPRSYMTIAHDSDMLAKWTVYLKTLRSIGLILELQEMTKFDGGLSDD